LSPQAQLVEVLCPDCGRVEVASFEIRLCVRVAGQEINVPQFGRAFYALRCPGCSAYFTREADARVAQLLIAAGAWTFTWTPPAELRERHPTGPPIVLDDLIDLHFDLEREFA
jgi:predicted RNA-binding Zn-ribbon protein involved in translation (DUF1610 family)